MSQSKKKLWITTLFVCYFPILVWIILFRVSISSSDFHNWRELNFIPFYYEYTRGDAVTLGISLMNIVVFMPVGVYSKMLGHSLLRTTFTGFIVTTLLETSQYALCMGVCDITDVITNTLGALLGWVFYRLLDKVCDEDKHDELILPLATVITVMFVMYLVCSVAGLV